MIFPPCYTRRKTSTPAAYGGAKQCDETSHHLTPPCQQYRLCTKVHRSIVGKPAGVRINNNFRRDSIKRLIVVLFVSLVMIGTTGCNSKEVENNQFIEKVKILETNEIDLDFLEITYDEFKENINGVFTPKNGNYYFENKDKRFFLNVDGEDLRMKDLENITEEEFKKYQEIIADNFKEDGIQKIDLKIEISDENYESIFEGEKRVYSKTTQIVYFDNKEPVETLIFKAYDFKSVDNKWGISKIEKSYAKASKYSEKALKTKLAFTAFTPENNRKIKYVESINFTYNPNE